jgi:hypothetical protein
MPTEIAQASTCSSFYPKGFESVSLARSMANYTMSRFQVPLANYDKMRAHIANHWWGLDDGLKRIH